MKILLNIIGVIIFFLNRFVGRKDKNKELSISFWIKDNWGELLIIALFDLALMMLVFIGGIELNFEKIAPMLPEGMKIAGDGAMCFLIGLFLAWAFYRGYQKIIKRK